MSTPAIAAIAEPATTARLVFVLRRVAARLMDGLVIWTPIVIVGAVSVLLAGLFGIGLAGSIGGVEGMATGLASGLLTSLLIMLELAVLVVVVPLAYLRWAAHRPGPRAGQTLGRQLADVRVARSTDPRPLRGRTLVLRELALTLWLLPVAVLGSVVSGITGSDALATLCQLAAIIAVVWQAADGRLPHDRMTGTQVDEGP